MTQNTALVVLKDVWKIYKMGEVDVAALCGINLEINEGEFVAITGPSGSGKSTIMNMVGCLDIPTKGTIFLGGEDISKVSESKLSEVRGKKIGFVFQQFNLVPNLSALENVMLPLEFQDVDSKIAAKISKDLLEQVGLGDRINHKPKELSGGQQQRVAIARSLAVDPEIILADEPTGNLDSKSGSFIMNFFKRLHEEKGKTVVIVTHDINLVKYGKKVIHLKDGVVERIENNGGNRK
jgi:putative ABC transport system ATP-binding protein